MQCEPLLSYPCMIRLAEDTALLKWVDDPGTFILRLVAAVGTGIGAFLLYNQVRQAERLETFRRNQKHKAQRALMPLRLSELTRYVEKSTNAVETGILRFESVKKSRTALLNSYEIPILSLELIEFFSNYIEFAPNNTVLIERMIGIIQYQDSRISGLSDREESRSTIIYNLYSYYLEYCILQCMINYMYDYARGRSDEFPCSVAWTDVIKNINFRNICAVHRDEIVKSAQRISEVQGEHVRLH